MRTTPLFAAAAAAYAANCALGASVALRLVDTRNVRWVHHALYIATASLTAVAVSSAVWGSPRAASRRGAAALAPAVVPLAAIPYAGTHTRRHPVIALSAAPFFVAGVARSGAGGDPRAVGDPRARRRPPAGRLRTSHPSTRKA